MRKGKISYLKSGKFLKLHIGFCFAVVILILALTPFLIAQENKDSEEPKELLSSMGITPYPELKELKELKFKVDWLQVDAISADDVNKTISNFNDLAWLKPIAQQSKVVLFGEHHYYQFIEHLRNRILFALNTFDHYHLLLLELQYSSTGFFEYYINIEDDTKSRDYYRNVIYDMIPTEEIFNILEHLRLWNKTHPDKYIHIGAYDIEHDFKTTIGRIIVPYFKKLDAGFNVDLEMFNWRDLEPLLEDVEKRLQRAKAEKLIGDYPFLTPKYMKCVLENLRSLFYSKKYEFNYYREKAMVRNLVDPRFFGKFFTEGKVMMHCGGYHASKNLQYPEGVNFFREGSYLTHDFAPTKGKTYALLARGYAYTLGPLADINLKTHLRYGLGYINVIKKFQKAYKKKLVSPEGFYLFNTQLDDFTNLVFKKAYENNHLPMLIKKIEWSPLIEKAKADSEEKYESILEVQDTFSQFDAVILVPRSPLVRLKEKIN